MQLWDTKRTWNRVLGILRFIGNFNHVNNREKERADRISAKVQFILIFSRLFLPYESSLIPYGYGSVTMGNGDITQD